MSRCKACNCVLKSIELAVEADPFCWHCKNASNEQFLYEEDHHFIHPTVNSLEFLVNKQIIEEIS